MRIISLKLYFLLLIISCKNITIDYKCYLGTYNHIITHTFLVDTKILSSHHYTNKTDKRLSIPKRIIKHLF